MSNHAIANAAVRNPYTREPECPARLASHQGGDLGEQAHLRRWLSPGGSLLTIISQVSRGKLQFGYSLVAGWSKLGAISVLFRFPGSKGALPGSTRSGSRHNDDSGMPAHAFPFTGNFRYTVYVLLLQTVRGKGTFHRRQASVTYGV